MATFFSENLLQYIFDAIKSRGNQFLFERLARNEYLKIKTDIKLKAFIKKASVEEVVLLLSKLGYGYVQFFWDKEKNSKLKIKDLLVREIKSSNLSEVMIKEKVFANSGNDLIQALQVISNTGASNTYTLNRKYIDLHNKIGNIKLSVTEDKRKAEQALVWTASMARKILGLEIELENYGISREAFMLLCLLQEHKPGASLPKIIELLMVSERQAKLLIRKLYSKNMIDRAIGYTDAYVLDSMGFICVQQILSKIQ